MDAYAALLLSALGGTVFRPILVRIARGDATAGVVAGLLGGLAALGVGEVLGPVLGPMLGETYGRPDLMRHAQEFLAGAIGGGAPAWLTGLVIRKA